MAGYTNIGCALWNWEPWTDLDSDSRILWLGLYTSSEAKRICPGLFHGGIGTMADAVRLQGDVVRTSLDRMIERGLVDYDQRNRVLRLTKLPDTGECPYNASTIFGWWNRFITLPVCRVRDAHVELVRWLYEAGLAAVTKPVMREQMEQAWLDRFGKIQIPEVPIRLQRLADSDTGTRVQPSLPWNAVPSLNLPSEEKQIDQSSDPGVVPPLGYGSGSGRGRGEGTGEGSFFDQDPDRVTMGPADQAQTSRKLELVPPPADAPFSVDDVLEALTLREDVLFGLPRDALWAEIARVARAGMGKPEIELVSRWAKSIGTRERIEILTTARLGDAVLQARRWEDEKRRQAERAAERSADFKAAQEQHAKATTKV